MDVILNFRVPPAIKEQLEKLAETTGRSKTALATEALQGYLEEQMWHVAEIKDAIKEADAGDFADQEEVEAVFNKHA
jgi:predicted transcriptional regulator